MDLSQLLQTTPAGLYCPAADLYVDPTRAVPRAVITHGHADHARAGHGAVLATPATLDIMRLRLGATQIGRTQALPYGDTTTLDGVTIRLVPAGHILGSAQVMLERGDKRAVVSGDYKRSADPTCAPFEPVPCDLFVTEATFALPVFRHPPAAGEIARLLASLQAFPERCHIVGAYSLGKAQRVLRLLRQAGYDRTIYVHGAIEKINAVYRAHGQDFGATAPLAGADPAALAGAIAIVPPGAGVDGLARRAPEPLYAMASGWMRVRARARQRGVEIPLVISDHADWPELVQTVDEMPGEVWITHGREDALKRHLELRARQVRTLSLDGYGDEDET